MNFSYLAIKLPNFKPVDKKLPELEPRVSHSFDIKTVLRKTLLKVLAPPQTHFQSNFLFQSLVLYMRYHNIFFPDWKLYLWSIHTANNLILAISFGFKLNSNLKLMCGVQQVIKFTSWQHVLTLPRTAALKNQTLFWEILYLLYV